jgi:hypothetical protein
MKEGSPISRVVDAIDVETYLVCDSKEEGGRLGVQLLKDLGFTDVDAVYVGYANGGARVRLRANVHRPGAAYAWMPRGGAR